MGDQLLNVTRGVGRRSFYSWTLDYKCFAPNQQDSYVLQASVQDPLYIHLYPLKSRENLKDVHLIHEYEPMPDGQTGVGNVSKALIYPDTIEGIWNAKSVLVNGSDIVSKGTASDQVGILFNHLDLCGDNQNCTSVAKGGGYYLPRIENAEQDNGSGQFNFNRNFQQLAYDRSVQKRFANAFRHYSITGNTVSKIDSITAQTNNAKLSRYVFPLVNITPQLYTAMHKETGQNRSKNLSVNYLKDGVVWELYLFPAIQSHCILTPWSSTTAQRNRSLTDDLRCSNFAVLRKIKFGKIYDEKKTKSTMYWMWISYFLSQQPITTSDQVTIRVQLARKVIRNMTVYFTLTSKAIAPTAIVNDYYNVSNGLLPIHPANTTFFAPNVQIYDFQQNGEGVYPNPNYRANKGGGIYTQLQGSMVNGLLGETDRINGVNHYDACTHKFMIQIPMNSIDTSELGAGIIDVNIYFADLQPLSQAGVPMDVTKLTANVITFYDEVGEITSTGTRLLR